MKHALALLIFILIGCEINCFAQGKITRTTRQQSQTSKPKELSPKVIVSEPDGYLNGHGYVDLGLPSGLKWATCNIGASSPEGHGDYFAWGEIYTKSSYPGDNSLTYGKSVETLKSEWIINSNGELTKSHDAASSKWGFSWRMPTKKEFDELVDKCEWQWTERGGKNGYKVTGPNGKSIFLPSAGRRVGSSLIYAGELGYYWSSAVYEFGQFCCAYYLYFSKGNHTTGWGAHTYGVSVRPVSE